MSDSVLSKPGLVPVSPRELAFPAYIRLNGNFSAVAAELGVQPETVRRWAANERWEDRIKEAQANLTEAAMREAHVLLRDLAPEAIGALADAMRNAVTVEGHPMYSIRVKAAAEILNRFGVVEKQEIRVDSTVRQATLNVTANTDPADAQEALEALRELLKR